MSNMDQSTSKRKTRTRDNGNSTSTTSCKPTHIQTSQGIRTTSKMGVLRKSNEDQGGKTIPVCPN